ncbi:hypothetical protein BCV70DRAFT_231296 [Testicularia cyperi]|uniref:Uncharacterized protein n=1 Tax=Testicularia cyperi TaxID=1882483 RepID=A0A317XSX8_9BASI|nr:hypothetical protein BCV70DRAFT_231296 [Testicularia cyperi]
MLAPWTHSSLSGWCSGTLTHPPSPLPFHRSITPSETPVTFSRSHRQLELIGHCPRSMNERMKNNSTEGRVRSHVI